MLISGPKTLVNIDVYLEPLIDELKDLWAGVDAYDALRKEDFTSRAALLWTINDFLHMDKTNFDWLVDNREPIAPKSTDEVLHDIDCSIGVSHFVVNKKKRKYLKGTKGWNKKSVFFNLPYWAKLKVRHNIDIMHVVKNVTESLTGTIFNIKGKTKDTWKSRQDLMHRGLKKSLHLQRRDILEKLEEKIVVILCKMEKMFPPSFFDIMTRLLIHLPYEAKISGPPEYQWMFPFER
nr:hypothetical protein [Tanacetum cinerariifolium]